MSVYLFTVPLVKGKTDTWKKYMKEITENRYEDYTKSRKRIGLKAEQVYLQQTPQGDICVVKWDTDNPKRIFQEFAKSNDQFDKWFRDKILVECHGMDMNREVPINMQYVDYRETPTREYAETHKNR